MPGTGALAVSLAERIEAACLNDWLTMKQMEVRLGCSKVGVINAVKHLMADDRLEMRKNPNWSGRQYHAVKPVTRARKALIDVAEKWGAQRDIDVKELVFRLQTKKVE